MSELTGKVALVTGAGRGIGRAAAIALAEKGATVAISARNEAELRAVAADIRAKVLSIPLDLAEAGAAEKLIAQVENSLGPVAILINNAAVAGPFGPSWQLDPDEWEKALRVNLTIPFRLARAALPEMLKAGWGRIINVSSGAARNPMERAGPYSTSKAGLDMLTRQLAADLSGTKIVSISFYPGIVDTEMQTSIRSQPVEIVGEALSSRFKQYYAQGQLLNPDVPGRVIAALATSAGESFDGKVIDVYSPEAQALLEN